MERKVEMKDNPTFFDFAAEVGLTKHIGGVEATDTLVELCRIDRDSYVLDVGCDVSATPCYLAKRYNCRVVGVDILEPERVTRRTSLCIGGVIPIPEINLICGRCSPDDPVSA